MKRAVTFELPPSPQCVIQKRTVVLRTEDAKTLLFALMRAIGWEHAEIDPETNETLYRSSDSPPSE